MEEKVLIVCLVNLIIICLLEIVLPIKLNALREVMEILHFSVYPVIKLVWFVKILLIINVMLVVTGIICKIDPVYNHVTHLNLKIISTEPVLVAILHVHNVTNPKLFIAQNVLLANT